MNIDIIRGLTSYVVGGLVVIIGLVSIVWLTANGTFPPDAGLPALTAIVGGAAAWMWNAESIKQASKQAEKNILQQPPEPPKEP